MKKQFPKALRMFPKHILIAMGVSKGFFVHIFQLKDLCLHRMSS